MPGASSGMRVSRYKCARVQYGLHSEVHSVPPADLNGDAAVTEGAAPGGALAGQGVAPAGERCCVVQSCLVQCVVQCCISVSILY